MRHRPDPLAGAVKTLRGAAKEILGRLMSNRLLEFEGQQDRLHARLLRRGVRPLLRFPRTLQVVRRP